jgi:hypothetical protein
MLVVSVLSSIEGTAPAGSGGQDGNGHFGTALGLMVWFGSDAYGDNGRLVQRLLVALVCGWPALLASALVKSS